MYKEREASGVEVPAIGYPRDGVTIFIGSNVVVTFGTKQTGKPIEVGEYDAVECYYPPLPQKVGFTIDAGNWLRCTPGTQTVIVHEIVWVGDTLDRFTITYQMVAKEGKTTGCVHYER